MLLPNKVQNGRRSIPASGAGTPDPIAVESASVAEVGDLCTVWLPQSAFYAAYVDGMTMTQWLSNLAPWEIYLIAAPCIMLGAILFFHGLILLLEPPRREGQ
jgi:hypothetical protein